MTTISKAARKRVVAKGNEIDAYAKKISELQRKQAEAEMAQAALVGQAVLKQLNGRYDRLDDLLEWIDKFDASELDDEATGSSNAVTTEGRSFQEVGGDE